MAKAKLRTPLPEVQAEHERIHQGLRAKLSSDPFVGPVTVQQDYATPQEPSSPTYKSGQPKYSTTAD